MTRKEAPTVRVDLASAETGLSRVIATIDAAWRHKRFDELVACFHPEAVITGPGFSELARGRDACVDSYRQFGARAEVLAYSESSHQLRVWASTAVYSYHWKMVFTRDADPVHEKGTDEMVFQKGPDGWQVVWRYVNFASAS